MKDFSKLTLPSIDEPSVDDEEEIFEDFLSHLPNQDENPDEELLSPVEARVVSILPPLRQRRSRGRKVGKHPQMIATLSSTKDQLHGAMSVTIGVN